jgi:hypothetical protein
MNVQSTLDPLALINMLKGKTVANIMVDVILDGGHP